MARFKLIDMSPRFLPVDFAQQVLPGTFEYALCHLVDHELDLSELEVRFRNDKNGAPAYAPSVLIKIVLLAYSRGIISSRAMQRACLQNVLFMAVSGDAQPDHSTLAAFVSGMGEVIAQLFARVLVVCDRQGLIGRELFAIPHGDFLRGVDRGKASVQCRQGKKWHTPGVYRRGRPNGGGRYPDDRAPAGSRCGWSECGDAGG